MLINENTKISELIAANKGAIEVIAGINKHFRKLNNPILRRTLARRVTIKEAAKIGGVSVDVFFERLAEIGFESEAIKNTEEMKIGLDGIKEEKGFSTEGLNVVELDVRPNIESGNDPFKIIMGAIKELKDGDVLKIINSFEPIPLINVLKGKGYQSKVERPETGIVCTYFLKNEEAQKDLEVTTTQAGNYEEVLASFGENLIKIDVRTLEMPEPMVKILSELEVLPEGHGLFVHHKKMPQFLIPELKSRGVEFVKKEIDDYNIDFIFFKQN